VIDPDKLGDLFAQVKKHNDETIRLTAYQALYIRFGKKAAVQSMPAKLALPHLIDATKDNSANIRLIGAQGLGNLGADAKDAAPILTAMLDDSDPRVRQAAKTSLEQIKAK